MYKKGYIEALEYKYNAQIKAHRIALDILMSNPVGIGEHTDYIEEAHKHVSAMAEARENLETLPELSES